MQATKSAVALRRLGGVHIPTLGSFVPKKYATMPSRASLAGACVHDRMPRSRAGPAHSGHAAESGRPDVHEVAHEAASFAIPTLLDFRAPNHELLSGLTGLITVSAVYSKKRATVV